VRTMKGLRWNAIWTGFFDYAAGDLLVGTGEGLSCACQVWGVFPLGRMTVMLLLVMEEAWRWRRDCHVVCA
jgi:hypothetical protein